MDYYNKYQKYKTKYSHLKIQIGGKKKLKNKKNINNKRITNNIIKMDSIFDLEGFQSIIIAKDNEIIFEYGDIKYNHGYLASCRKSILAILYGMYPSDKSQRVRRMLKRVYRFLSKSEGINKAEGSSFRLLDASIVNNIKKHEYSFIWLDEMFLWYNPNPEFVQLYRVENGANKVSRYSLFKLIGLTFNVMLYTTTIPLRLFIYVGFSLSVINFLIGTFYIIKKLAFGSQVGYTSLIVSILFTSGIILIGIGIIGIYLSRLYSLMNKEPRYTIEEKKC